jgi:2,3-dihydroxybenzoate decarboxylase
MRTIALEEHFTTPELAAYAAGTASIAQPGIWAEAVQLLVDRAAERLPAMDAAGVDVQVLSLNAPGIQAEKDPAAAVTRAAAANDLLAGIIAETPDRFAGFAALPTQDPQAAQKELERAGKQLGFKGAVIDAHTQGRYLDDPTLRVVWEDASGLDVPLYLHPANGVDPPRLVRSPGAHRSDVELGQRESLARPADGLRWSV